MTDSVLDLDSSDDAAEAGGKSYYYVSEREIIRRLGFGEKKGRSILKELMRDRAGRKPYPKPDPLFAHRRFWPEVLQWHMDYHRVRRGLPAEDSPSTQPVWKENFDTPKTQEARKPRHARA